MRMGVAALQNTTSLLTDDKMIRSVLRAELKDTYTGKEHPVKIIDELGIRHGTVRVDISTINGFMHGYEIKSDRDTLERLPEQAQHFSAVFDQMTLVVGKTHLLDALANIPDWWGVRVAVTNTSGVVTLRTIREPEDNPCQDSIAIMQLLWRDEALRMLEEVGGAKGFRSKQRSLIYEQVASVFDLETLKQRVRETRLDSRQGWRPDVPLMSGGD